DQVDRAGAPDLYQHLAVGGERSQHQDAALADRRREALLARLRVQQPALQLAPRRQGLAVRGEGHRIQARALSEGEPAALLPCRRVPETDSILPFVRQSRQGLALWGKGQGGNRLFQGANQELLLARGGVPQADGQVQSARGHRLAVGRKGGAIDDV